MRLNSSLWGINGFIEGVFKMSTVDYRLGVLNALEESATEDDVISTLKYRENVLNALGVNFIQDDLTSTLKWREKVLDGLSGGWSGGGGEINLQSKTATPTKAIQNVVPDNGYDGLSRVTINPIPNEYISPSGAIEITENGTIDVRQYASAEVNVEAGGWSLDGFLNKTEPTGEITINTVPKVTLTGYTGITKVNILTRFTSVGGLLSNCTNLVTVYAPLVTAGGTSYFCQNCSKLKTVVIGSPNTRLAMARTPNVEVIDIVFGAIASENFAYDSKLTTLILRKNGAIHALSSAASAAFQNTPFKSGGTGGTIYIPEALYNHLGDGTDLDYKAATNWSVLDGYGTVTWAKIEGSIYENQYADGHPLLHMTITQNLTHCASSNNASSVELGKAFTTTLTADAGYSLSSVTVTRGGTDITSTAYDSATGVVFVDNCHNDIVITATAA